jgi:pimeloyl-ACP methyl ester carboxylesterase
MSGSATMELVHVVTRDGEYLDGLLQRPAQDRAARLGCDVVTFHHGAGASFHMPSLIDEYSPALLEAGCAILRVDNRGHDLVTYSFRTGGRYPRVGAAFEDLDDCRHDWAAWADFAAEQGFERIVHWGHSLGATKSIYALAAEHDPRVAGVVASSPPRFSYSAYAALPEGPEFLHAAAEAERRVAEGAPETLLEITYPVPLLIAAGPFVDKYGPAEKHDILRHIPEVRVPLLITIGTAEAETMTAFKGLPPEVERLAAGSPNVRFASIDGADHAYSNHRPELWDVVHRWLSAL